MADIKMNLADYEHAIIAWSAERGILTHSTPLAQLAKLVSEMGELADNIGKGRYEAAQDDIGDCFVVLCNIAALIGTDMQHCAQTAWLEVKDRRGRMVEGGVFIKEGDE